LGPLVKRVPEDDEIVDLEGDRGNPLIFPLVIGQQPVKKGRTVVAKPLLSIDHDDARQDEGDEACRNQKKGDAQILNQVRRRNDAADPASGQWRGNLPRPTATERTKG